MLLDTFLVAMSFEYLFRQKLSVNKLKFYHDEQLFKQDDMN